MLKWIGDGNLEDKFLKIRDNLGKIEANIDESHCRILEMATLQLMDTKLKMFITALSVIIFAQDSLSYNDLKAHFQFFNSLMELIMHKLTAIVLIRLELSHLSVCHKLFKGFLLDHNNSKAFVINYEVSLVDMSLWQMNSAQLMLMFDLNMDLNVTSFYVIT